MRKTATREQFDEAVNKVMAEYTDELSAARARVAFSSLKLALYFPPEEILQETEAEDGAEISDSN